MTEASVERKRQLIWELAEQLGIQIRELKKSSTKGLGFRAPRIEALAATAERFADIMAGATRTEREQALEELVDRYWRQYTNRTEKSEPGGSRSGMKAIVRCGHSASRIHERLQARVEHWQGVKNSAPPGETQADAAKRVAQAERYIGVRDPKKHVGRPSKTIGRIEIKQTNGGTNIDSITWEVGRMFLDHGDAVLADDVLDAVLDNGGPLSPSMMPSPALQEIRARLQCAIESATTPALEVKLLKKALAALEP